MSLTLATEIELKCSGKNGNIFSNIISSMDQTVIIDAASSNDYIIYNLPDNSKLFVNDYVVEERRPLDYCRIFLDSENIPKILYSKLSIDLAESLAYSRGYSIDFSSEQATNLLITKQSFYDCSPHIFESTLIKI